MIKHRLRCSLDEGMFSDEATVTVNVYNYPSPEIQFFAHRSDVGDLRDSGGSWVAAYEESTPSDTYTLVRIPSTHGPIYATVRNIDLYPDV